MGSSKSGTPKRLFDSQVDMTRFQFRGNCWRNGRSFAASQWLSAVGPRISAASSRREILKRGTIGITPARRFERRGGLCRPRFFWMATTKNYVGGSDTRRGDSREILSHRRKCPIDEASPLFALAGTKRFCTDRRSRLVCRQSCFERSLATHRSSLSGGSIRRGSCESCVG